MVRRLLLVLCAAAGMAAAGDLRAGRASVAITPPRGMPMAGYYSIRLNEGVHDDLFAKALVLDKDGVRVALVALDLIGIPRPFVEEARKRIERETAIRGTHVMISATHTHTGPEMGSRLVNMDEATRKIVQSWHAGLPEQIAAAVRQAVADLRPARVSAAIGSEDSIAFVRRYVMKDGSIGWNPGKLNPNIVRPAGEIDPAVPVVLVEAEDGNALAACVNYANHLDTTGGLEFSADYPYTLAKILGDVKGPQMVTLFTLGTAGNINHIDVGTKTPQKGYREAARIGAILAGEVLRTMRRLSPADEGPLRASVEIVSLPATRHEPADVARARDVVARYGKPDAAPFYEQVKAFRVLDVEARGGAPFDAEVQVIALGSDIAWVGLPGEIFVELGKAIKLASPFPVTLVASLANGSYGYVPDRRAYPQGAYEVISSRFAAGAGELLVESAVRQLIELHTPGVSAQPARSPSAAR